MRGFEFGWRGGSGLATLDGCSVTTLHRLDFGLVANEVRDEANKNSRCEGKGFAGARYPLTYSSMAASVLLAVA